MRRGMAAALALLAPYAAGPAVAAFLEAGDRWGPKIYPRWYHEAVYLIAWDWSSHRERKPRLGFWFKEEYRPWFYGLYSKNHDPEYYQPILGNPGPFLKKMEKGVGDR